jgi:hypothetical protein
MPPTPTLGAEADAMARRVQEAVGIEAWERTGAIRWTFNGKRQHLWDRRRGLDRVRWPAGEQQIEVLLDIGRRAGIARRDGQEVSAVDAGPLIEQAYAAWINDGFWLYPFDRLFQPEVELGAITSGADEALYARWRSGGLTPGDTYVWSLGAGGRPESWNMWVSVAEPGTYATWEGWQQIATGAWISTVHTFSSRELRLTEVAGARTLAKLEPGDDPFAPLVARLQDR